MIGKILIGLTAMLFILPVSSGYTVDTKYEIATFAGGCFWCMDAAFEDIPGVIEVITGYTGGHTKNPTYEEVSAGRTGHAEAIQVTYDPAQITYPQLLDVFWKQVDPTDRGGQMVDRGSQYRTEIFYHTDNQKRLAEQSKQALKESGRFDRPIVTEITKATEFYPAEEYHQHYFKKNPLGYNSGRDNYLKKIWTEKNSVALPRYTDKDYKKPSIVELKKELTPLQFAVTQKQGTETPFDNEYWNNEHDGIYVDIVSGEPLFSSLDKYDSGTGWPSFTKPLEPGNIVEKQDRSSYMLRIDVKEVRSKLTDSHLGHVFTDGPAPTGLRYCMNSAALLFIPKEDLTKEGYGRYLNLFKKDNEF